jgi:hypothetical protein
MFGLFKKFRIVERDGLFYCQWRPSWPGPWCTVDQKLLIWTHNDNKWSETVGFKHQDDATEHMAKVLKEAEEIINTRKERNQRDKIIVHWSE